MGAPLITNRRINTNCGRALLNIWGAIDGDAEMAFMYGHCHSLALAIHKLTGWPIYGLWKWQESYNCNPDSPHHVVVQMPCGSYLDIRGKGVKIAHYAVCQEIAVKELGNYRRPLPKKWVMPYAKAVLETFV